MPAVFLPLVLGSGAVSARPREPATSYVHLNV